MRSEGLSSDTSWRWPFPFWSHFDPSSTLWDPIGKREVCFFYEIKDLESGRRTALYSAWFPHGLYHLEDHGELGDPPEAAGVPLSGDELWPRVQPDWLIYSGPRPYNFDEIPGPTWLKEIWDFNATKEEMLAEIRTLELLLRSPHPHLPAYFGCLVEGDCQWVSGVVLPRYPKRLADIASSGELEAIDRPRVVAELQSAIAHLHSHGLAHNDVSPWNVMLDDALRVILIDFGACLPFGQYIPAVRGTPGFCTGDWTTSDPAHDTYGLEAVRRFLDDSAVDG